MSQTPTKSQPNGSHKTLKALFPHHAPLLSNPKIPALKEAPITYNPTCSRQAGLQLDCLIIGAGIAGLATAIALSRSGHSVHILEKRRQAIPEFTCGTLLPPNLTKILCEWGLGPELAKAPVCSRSEFKSAETNETHGRMEWQADVIRETGGDFLMIHYKELYKMLYDKALALGVSVSCDIDVLSVTFDDERGAPVARLADDSILTADLILGADGPTSVVREALTGLPNVGQPSGSEMFSILVPAEELKDDPDWSKWIAAPQWPIWMGTNIAIVAHPTENLEHLSVSAFLPSQGDAPEAWSNLYPTELIDFTGCHPCFERIFLMAKTAVRTPIFFRPTVEDWVHESATIALVGESAHPLIFFTSQNAALVVEDAVVLGGLLSHLSSRDQLPQLLEAYQDIRMPRVKFVHETELNNVSFGTQDDTELQVMRNEAMKSTLDRTDTNQEAWDDNLLRAQWDAMGAEFCYHAGEAAEDWWTKWGAITRKADTQQTRFELKFEVSQVVESV